MKKQFLSTIPELPGSELDLKSTKKWKAIENYWYLLAVFFGLLLLYALARIISLQRRVRDLEARPPVDDITLRGAVRLQLNDLVSDLEQSLRAKQSQAVQEPVKFEPLQVDHEINQVLEIANSVKSSLPDLKLFANAIKQQKIKNESAAVEVEPKEDLKLLANAMKQQKIKNESAAVEVEILPKEEHVVDAVVEEQIDEVTSTKQEEEEKQVEVEEKRWATPKKKIQKKRITNTRKKNESDEVIVEA
jgi:hypothetical protein